MDAVAAPSPPPWHVTPLRVSQRRNDGSGTNACGYCVLRLCAAFVHSNAITQLVIEQHIAAGVHDWERAGSTPSAISMAALHELVPPARYDLRVHDEIIGLNLGANIGVSDVPITLRNPQLGAELAPRLSLSDAIDDLHRQLLLLPRDHSLAAALSSHGHTVCVAMQSLPGSVDRVLHVVDTGLRDAVRGSVPCDDGSAVWVRCRDFYALVCYLQELLPPERNLERFVAQTSTLDEHYRYVHARTGARVELAALFTLITYVSIDTAVQLRASPHSSLMHAVF